MSIEDFGDAWKFGSSAASGAPSGPLQEAWPRRAERKLGIALRVLMASILKRRLFEKFRPGVRLGLAAGAHSKLKEEVGERRKAEKPSHNHRRWRPWDS